jgi:hypothetical protein
MTTFNISVDLLIETDNPEKLKWQIESMFGMLMNNGNVKKVGLDVQKE